MRVGVLGAAGRMGATVCAAVRRGGRPGAGGRRRPQSGRASRPPGDRLDRRGARRPGRRRGPRSPSTSRWRLPPRPTPCGARRSGIHTVIGTTGLGEAALAELADAFPSQGATGCVVAPNFAIGAVLMMRFAELAAPWFETAEIIELHHDAKVDAPSGTALFTANRMAAASAEWGADPTRVETVGGCPRWHRAGRHPHPLRTPAGLVAHQEVLLGTAGQSLTIRHDSYDRQSFMPGVLLASPGAPPGRV